MACFNLTQQQQQQRLKTRQTEEISAQKKRERKQDVFQGFVLEEISVLPYICPFRYFHGDNTRLSTCPHH